MFSTLKRPALLVAVSAALGACTMYGGGYGRSVVSVGYSTGGYYPYGSRYDPYSYYGWYDGFYYPGAGYYVYDRRGSRYRWNDRHRRYWEGRRGDRAGRENWSGWRGEQFSGRRDGDWQDRDRRNRDSRWQGRGDGRQDRQGWQGRGDGRQDRQGWQGRGSGQQVAPTRAVPQRVAPARQARQNPERRQSRAERAREFGRSKDKRRD